MFCLQIHARAGRTMNEKFSIMHEAKPSAVLFCLQIHARAGRTMNEKFSILHEAKPSAVLKILFKYCSSACICVQVRVFVNKTRTNSL